MRPRTVLALAVVVVALGGAAVYGFVVFGSSGGDLSVRWVSDTARDAQVNHHAPAAGRPGGTGMVYAPISGRANTTQCELVGLASANGSARWRYQVARAACAVHAVADPTLADYDDDGTREVVVATSERELSAFDPLTGEKELAYGLSAYGYTQPLVADLLGDDRSELVVVDAKGTVSVARPDGTTVWTHRLSSYTWGQPAVADFDGDGGQELVVGASDGTLTLFEPDGTVRWRRQAFEGSITWMTSGRADGDPDREVFVATDDGAVAAVDGASGAVDWRREFGAFAAVHAVGDGDGDGEPEVYAVAKDGMLRGLDASDGTTEWTTRLTTDRVQMMPPPSLGDVDGDGSPELVAVTNDGIVSVVDPTTGDVRATYDREVPIYVHPTLADTDGDGVPEIYVIYSDGRVVSLAFA